MKKILLLSLLGILIFPFYAWPQSKQIEKLFDKYEDHESFTFVDIKSGLFEILAEIESEDDEDIEELKEVVDGLESLRLLACEIHNDENKSIKDDFIDDVNNSIPFNEYQDLMVVKNNEANIRFIGKTEGSIISEAIMIVDGEKEAVLIVVSGDIDVQNLVQLGTSFDFYEGMEYFQELEKEK